MFFSFASVDLLGVIPTDEEKKHFHHPAPAKCWKKKGKRKLNQHVLNTSKHTTSLIALKHNGVLCGMLKCSSKWTMPSAKNYKNSSTSFTTTRRYRKLHRWHFGSWKVTSQQMTLLLTSNVTSSQSSSGTSFPWSLVDMAARLPLMELYAVLSWYHPFPAISTTEYDSEREGVL